MSDYLPDLVPDESGARVQVDGPLQHLCPHVDEVDSGAVTITWTCAGSTLELHSLGAYLRSFARWSISHEELTSQLQQELRGLPGITDVSVASSWNTAGLDVVVKA